MLCTCSVLETDSKSRNTAKIRLAWLFAVAIWKSFSSSPNSSWERIPLRAHYRHDIPNIDLTREWWRVQGLRRILFKVLLEIKAFWIQTQRSDSGECIIMDLQNVAGAKNKSLSSSAHKWQTTEIHSTFGRTTASSGDRVPALMFLIK